ncbi:uncharacterized protein LOC135848566 [Planococcus citri]|uniref:uncharacterized protein LOC135848566 n=1 Tax=Planococcus citri TaxID=170843 RepID=UPI0031F83813
MLPQINAIGVCLMIIIILCGIDGENDATSRGNEINSSGNEIDLSKCRNITTNNDSYTFYPVEDIKNEGGFFLRFNVKAERGVHIMFSPTNLTANSNHKGFEVVILVSVGEDNATSVIRTTQGSEKNTLHTHYEMNMVSSDEWRQFWIRLTSDGTLIEVGKKGSIPFMSSRTEPRLIEYYGFASDNISVNYAFLCFDRNNIDISQYRTLTTYDDGYTFYPIEEIKNNGPIFLKFMVETDQDAYIIFSPTNETVKKDERIFKVILGGYTTNTVPAIKTTELAEPASEHYDKDILLSPDEWRPFWIRITRDGASIEVGKNASSAFMSLKTEPRPIKYYGFASSGSFANWAFPSVKDSKTVTNVCIPSPCGPNSECKQKDNRAICSCKKNQLDSPSTCRFECVFNSECPQNKACIGKKCQDPCAGNGMCGKNTSTTCEVENHVPICSCKPGLTGDPSIECVKEEDLPKYRSLKTHRGATFYPISVIKNDNQIFLKFNVNNEETARIYFSSTVEPMKEDQYFAVGLLPREQIVKIESNPPVSTLNLAEKNSLSNEKWRPFWIRITPDGLIEVGKNIGELAYMSQKNDPLPWPIKYFVLGSTDVCHWNFVSSKDTNIDLLRHRTYFSKTAFSTLYPIADINNDDGFFLEFNVKAYSSARIIFTEKNDPEISSISQNNTKYQGLDIFHVVIEKTHLSIRTTPAGEEQVSYDEDNLISVEEWHPFWIRITTDGSSIEVGKNGRPALASLKTKPRIIKYFGFSSAGHSNYAYWAFPPQIAKVLVFL